jgi:hypothetical protein
MLLYGAAGRWFNPREHTDICRGGYGNLPDMTESCLLKGKLTVNKVLGEWAIGFRREYWKPGWQSPY